MCIWDRPGPLPLSARTGALVRQWTFTGRGRSNSISSTPIDMLPTRIGIHAGARCFWGIRPGGSRSLLPPRLWETSQIRHHGPSKEGSTSSWGQRVLGPRRKGVENKWRVSSFRPAWGIPACRQVRGQSEWSEVLRRRRGDPCNEAALAGFGLWARRSRAFQSSRLFLFFFFFLG